MIEKIFDFIMSNPYMLVPFIVTIPSVHFLKQKFIKEKNSFKVLGLSFIVSFIFTLIPTFVYNSKILDYIVYQISFSVACVIVSSGIVVIFGKAIKAGLLDSVFNFFKNFLNKDNK